MAAALRSRRQPSEQALARLIPGELSADLGNGIDAECLDPMLSRGYESWPFVEYGLFLELCYTVRGRWATRSRCDRVPGWGEDGGHAGHRAPEVKYSIGLVTESLALGCPLRAAATPTCTARLTIIDAAVELVTRRGVLSSRNVVLRTRSCRRGFTGPPRAFDTHGPFRKKRFSIYLYVSVVQTRSGPGISARLDVSFRVLVDRAVHESPPGGCAAPASETSAPIPS